MSELKDYVKSGFLDLPEKFWDSEMIERFIISSASYDTDTHERIKDVDLDDLLEYIADFSNDSISSEVICIQALMRIRAKEEIRGVLLEIEEEQNTEEMDYD